MVKRYTGGVLSANIISVNGYNATGMFNMSYAAQKNYTSEWPRNRNKTTSADLLVVGGGGGGGTGGAGYGGGGGGAGGFKSYGSIPISPGTTYAIVVGSGGAVNANGSASSFNVTYTAGGGGRGGKGGGLPAGLSVLNGAIGSSGGGGGTVQSPTSGRTLGGSGLAGEGTPGGSGTYSQGTPNMIQAGGGGGAYTGNIFGMAFTTAPATYAGNGGAGLAWVDSIVYSGGGGGSSFTHKAGVGGLGGGGNGDQYFNKTPSSLGSGQEGTGGGGGGVNPGGPVIGFGGGSGVVALRHPSDFAMALNYPGGRVNITPDYVYYYFNQSGDITF